MLSASEDRATIDSAVAGGRERVRAQERERARHPGAACGRWPPATRSSTAPPSADDAGDGRRAGPELTEREATILAAVAGGKTTKAISAELWVSEHTVKFHLTNIYRKLGVSNRSGAVRYAFEHGLVGAD